MDNMFQFDILILYFVYGLSFYTMGVAIALQYRSYSSFRLAYSLSLLAAFALLHGISEWGSVFIPLKVPDFGDFPLWKLIAVQRILQSVSYFFLFCFGVKLISDTKNQNFFMWIILPTTAFLIWLFQFARFIPLIGTYELLKIILHSEMWSRYLLAFPAGLFTAYGLALQVPDAKNINDKSVIRNLWGATAAFICFALFSGLIIPQNTGGLGNLFNSDTFRRLTGMPIELFRTGTALLATWAITRILAIFDLEKQRQVAESRRLETVLRERERFARDLHDDVIQSIYGVGLALQTTTNLIEKENKKASGQINGAIERLNNVIHSLRSYIKDLQTSDVNKDLQSVLTNMVKEFEELSGIRMRLSFQVPLDIDVKPLAKSDNWEQHLWQIVREALNNAVQHANATKVQVSVKKDENQFIIAVQDNGRGMYKQQDYHEPEVTGKHLGLKNMRTRAMILGGELEIKSRRGKGTCITVSVPIENGLDWS